MGILCATRYFRDTAANKNVSTILHLWHFHFSREGQTINKYVINKKNKTVIALKIYGRCYIKWYLCKDKRKYEKKVSKEEHFMQREQLAWKPGVGEHLVCWRAARRPYSTWEVGLENGEEVGDKCSLCRALWGTVRTLHYTLNERRFNQWRDVIWLTSKSSLWMLGEEMLGARTEARRPVKRLLQSSTCEITGTWTSCIHSSGSYAEQSNLGYVVKVDLIKFANGLDVVYKERGR